uniref:L2 n=1 Tax=Miniopterus schreibersii papillomavirus 1 TaxID=1195364 RepID=I3VR54_9PAPI|nr:L2 [Miniopterus schreibersii papillomavirus 1]
MAVLEFFLEVWGLAQGVAQGVAWGMCLWARGEVSAWAPQYGPPSPQTPIIPPDGLPIDTIGPLDPVVLQGSEDTTTVFNNVDVFAEVSPPDPSLDSVAVGPTVTDGGSSAVLEISPDPNMPVRTSRISRTHYHNPTYVVNVHSTASSGETSLPDDIIIAAGHSDTVIGRSGEDVPLRLFRGGPPSTAEVSETSFGGGDGGARTSTPIARGRRPALTSFLRRGVEQVEVTERDFLLQPGRLVEFGFDNPAYDPLDEVTLQFQQDVEDIARAAPTVEFRDIIELNRGVFSETPEGGIRLSRLGRRGTIRTRAGTVLGGRVHFFQNLSDISEADIPLLTYGEVSGSSQVAVGDTSIETALDTVDLDAGELAGTIGTYPDEELLDVYEPVGEDSHLVIGGGGRRSRVQTLPSTGNLFSEGLEKTPGGYVVNWDGDIHGRDIPVREVIPGLTITAIPAGGQSIDFLLHPGLFPKRRRRRRTRRHSYL